ncbi:MAG: amino acid-binding domain protein [Cryobacterium sp.]|jgi:hypothetical protein|nr:amino acid-binding domain protein [Cryobacterium sp.]
MKHNTWTATADELSCDACGRLPEPPKPRQALANIAAVLPIELLVHAVVVHADLPYLVKVLLLTVTASVLVLWVAEPSARRLLRTWLHAPALRRRRRLETSPSLWRARVVVRDEPGALQRLAGALAEIDTNILDIHVHAIYDGALDELVLSAPGHVGEHVIVDALEAGGGRECGVWPTTALALADGQTKALSLAARVVGDPAELPLAVAELLSAEIVSDSQAPGWPDPVVKVPTAWRGPLIFTRKGEPFTTAESARANRLAEIAELVELREAARSGRSLS